MATPYIYRRFTIAYNDTKSETDTKYYIGRNSIGHDNELQYSLFKTSNSLIIGGGSK